MSESTIRLNVNLTGETAKRFLEIKKHMGIENNTELVRLITNDYFEKEIDKVEV